jgi:signal transduction histidine kinase
LPPGDEREAIFEEILRQTQRVNRAINDLLSYARPSTPELLPGSLNDPLRRALTLMDAQKNAAHVTLDLFIEPNLPPVLVDTQQMQQVLVNLMMNGLQAMPTGGTLTVKSGFKDSEVFIEISDTGPGIPKEIMQDIFKPFFTTKHQGTGLGLSICRSIIENHCGRIEVESERGNGALFRISLPVYRLGEEVI